MHTFFYLMPKAELHLHLDGAVHPQLALHLILQQNMYAEVLETLKNRDKEWLSQLWEKETLQTNYELLQNLSTDYQKLTESEKHLFISALRLELCVSSCKKNQKELLELFDLPIKLLQTASSLEQVCEYLIKSKQKDNVKYVEIRFAPLLHIFKQLSVAEVIKTVCNSIKKYSLENGITSRIIICVLRNNSISEALNLLKEATPYLNEGIVGVDIAGPEEENPCIKKFLPFFNEAKKLGLKTTFHAGETWKTQKESEEAIYELKPHRIAHGSILIKNQKILDYLKNKQISLDLCPTSNIQASLWDNHSTFPLNEFIDKKIPITLNTDDLVVSDLSLSDEYQNMYKSKKYSLRELWLLNLAALDYSFLDIQTKERLKTEFIEEYHHLLNGRWRI